MIIINKKRLQIIVSCILIGLLAFSMQVGNVQNNTIETTSTPVSEKTVILDAGHGTPDEGAESSSRHNRSRYKFSYYSKSSKTIRAKSVAQLF